MEINELYSVIKNPIDNPEIVIRLIDDYSKSKEGKFYDRVITSNNKEYSDQEYTVEDIDKFYSTIYNAWKKSVETITYDEYMALGKKGIYTQDFIPFRRALMEQPDFESVAEINELLHVDENEKTADENGFARVFNKYRWEYQVNEKNGMIKISSSDVHSNKPEIEDGPHRLYLNPESVDIFTLLTEFIKKCEENNLPYDFEYNQNSKNDMPVIIKATDDTITEYIDILKTISDKYPEMKSRMKNPPILTGNIDNWIGYGYELDEEYNKSRIDLVEESIKEVTNDWIINNKYMVLSSDDETVRFIDYISSICTDDIISKIQIEGNKEEYRKKVFERVSSIMDDTLTSIANGKEVNLNIISETDYQDAVLDTELITNILRESAYIISKMDPDFTRKVKDKILVKALEKNIDPNKFCVDNDYTMVLFGSEELEPIETEEFGLDDLEDEPFDLESIKVDKLPEIEEKQTLTNSNDEVEIIDFEELDNEPEHEIITDTSAEDISKELTSEDNALEKIEEVKPKKSFIKRIIDEITEEVEEPVIEEPSKDIQKESINDLMDGAKVVESVEQDDIIIPEPKSEKDDIEIIESEPKSELTDIKTASAEPKSESKDSITIIDLEITLPNGNTMTLGDYYNNYYKQGKPLNAYVNLKDGKTIHAREFMQYIVLPSIGVETLEGMSSKVKKM